jgi:methylenetetrahydrofolate dehydrogenase (NADP+)/methenyltetrahydrofolate cyclohydrolase
MTILDGKKLSEKIKNEVKIEAETLKKEGITPGLAVILVGEDPASQVYVKMKAKSCKDSGIYSVVHEFPETISQEELLDTIERINKNPNIHGLLIQLP